LTLLHAHPIKRNALSRRARAAGRPDTVSVAIEMVFHRSWARTMPHRGGARVSVTAAENQPKRAFDSWPPDAIASLVNSDTSPRQRRLALGFAGALLAIALTSLMFVGKQVPAIHGPAFFTAYDIVSACFDWATAFLLIAQFRQAGSPALLCVAVGYLFTGGMAILHLLSIPGLLFLINPFGTDNIALWYRVCWASAVPLSVLASVAARHFRPVLRPARATLLACLVALLLMATVFVSTRAAVDWLPDLTAKPETFSTSYSFALPLILAIQISALGALWRTTRARSVLSLWLMLAVFCGLIEIIIGWDLLGVLPDRRYSVNFYVARLAGAASSSVLLLGLLTAVGALYGRLAGAQNTLEQRVKERTAELTKAITQRNSAEEMFRQAVESCPSGLVMNDRSGRIVLINSEAERLFAYRREELIGRPFDILVPVRLRPQHALHRDGITRNSEILRVDTGSKLFGLRKDGTEFPGEIRLNPVRTSEGLFVLNMIVDISERNRLDRLKDEFVANVSHELRTPLTSISGSLGGGAGKLPEPAARLLTIAQSNSQRLVRLVNDILDIEKMESSEIAFDFQRVETRALIEQAIEGNRSLADGHGVQVRLDPASTAGEVYVDPHRLAQALTNLLSNAIKFSPPNGEVLVAIQQRDNDVRISVRDQGPGIPADFKPHVFEKFAQADATNAGRKGGTGLGLSIVKQIVNRLGGTVDFEDSPGGGTAFHLDLPGLDRMAARGILAHATIEP
jgi:PAS domain S-box-containing protein